MTQQKKNRIEIDELMHNALVSDEDMQLPEELVDKAWAKYERKLIIQRIIADLLLKTGIVMGSIAILFVIYYWVDKMEKLDVFIQIASKNLHSLLSVLFILLFIVVIDQVVLKFLFLKKHRLV